MDNTKQHWLAEEKEDLLSSGENDQRSYALRPALKRLLTKVLSHSARAIAYRRGKRLAYCFVPSPLRAYYWNEIPPKAKQFPTTYLTGMRGIAAVKVYTFHYLHFFSDATFVPWGRDDQHKLFLELPIVQFLYAGTTAQIFFVVAGYLMTLQIVQLFDKHEPASRSKAFPQHFRCTLSTIFQTVPSYLRDPRSSLLTTSISAFTNTTGTSTISETNTSPDLGRSPCHSNTPLTWVRWRTGLRTCGG